MDKKIKQIIGVILAVYGIAQIIGGTMGKPIIPNNDVVTMLLGSPIVTIGFIVVGLLLIFEKKKWSNATAIRLTNFTFSHPSIYQYTY